MTSTSPSSSQIVVVGAGIVGITTALQLQQAGMQVLLLDRDAPAAGASSGNAGALAISEVIPLAEPGVIRKVPGWLLNPLGPLAVRWRYLPGLLPWLGRFMLASRPSRVRDLSLQLASLLGRATQDYQQLLHGTALAAMWRRHGALTVYPDAAMLTADLERWQQRGQLGVRWQRCTAEQARQLEPALKAPWLHAIDMPDWSHVDDPQQFALGLFQLFCQAGGRFQSAGVTRLDEQGGKVRGVILADGSRVLAEQVVIASGVWSDAFARQLGQTLPLESERGYHLTLPHAGMPLQRYLLNAPESFVILPMANGGLRLAGTVELASRDAPADYRRAHMLLDKASAMLGPLDSRGMTAWMGNRPSVPDTVPVIGPSRRHPNVLFACGHGHLGLTLAATTAAMLRAHLLGQQALPDFLVPSRYQP